MDGKSNTNKFQETLRRLQLFETDMLKDFDKVCNKYGIQYFAVFGTAIGAIRHHGFIPWDDDIDLGMLLKDYRKLLEIPKFEWDNCGLELITANDYYPSHLIHITQLYKKGTIFESEKRIKTYKIGGPNQLKRPIWIDIFIYNHIASPEIAKKYQRKMIFLHRLYWRANTGMNIVRTDSISFQLRCLRNEIIHMILGLTSDPKDIYKKYYKFIESLDDAGGEYITSFESEFSDEIITSVSKEVDMFPLIRVPFEDTEIYIQKNYDEMLSSIYGDYMTLPPPEKRINHAPYILDFGDGKGNIIGDN